jgi:transcriptional regulator with XRE-family HTH domain
MLSEKIRELRIANSMTQIELATALSVTKQCVSNWENNNIQPSVDMLVKIAKFFAVSTDYLLCIDKHKYLDVNSLTDIQIAHIRQIVEDISAKN